MIEEIKIDRLEELIQEMMKKIRDTYPTESAEGNPIEIDNAAAAPLVKCVTAITGSQSGSGTPSYDNVRPITAFSEGEIEISDADEKSTTYAATFPDTIYQGTEDLVNGTVTEDWLVVDLGDLTWNNGSTTQPNKYRFRSDSIENLLQPSTPTESPQIICEKYGTVTANETYNGIDGISIEYVSTYPHRISIFDDAKSGMTPAEFKTAVTGIKIAYKLAIPSTKSITVSNAPVASVHGYNKIESSTGDMEVTYITEEFEPLANVPSES